MQQLKDKLEEIAAKEVWGDDDDDGYVNAFEYSGGNFDDAYYGGQEVGEVQLARRLLKEYFNE